MKECCGEVAKSVVDKCWEGVLWRGVVKKCCEGML